MNEGIDIYTFERSNNNEVSYYHTYYKFLEPK
jgi:hypothetical protein